MKLFIQVKDGMCVNHPALEENLIEAFERVPDDWEPFIRVEQPIIGLYEVLESPTPRYEKSDGIWMDVWSVRQMTPEEVEAVQKPVKDAWDSQYQAENFADWVFVPETLSYVPPIPGPTPVPGVNFKWCGAWHDWRIAPAKPEDGKNYRFNFFEWKWEEILDV
jgi:hypothetical protein